MGEFLYGLALVANLITVIAGFIAIAGVAWAFLGRARLEMTSRLLDPSVAPSLMIAVTSVGSQPVRNLEVAYGQLDDNGFAMKGDGAPIRATLNRGETVTVTGYDPTEMTHLSAQRDDEVRWPVGPGEGWFLTVQWQSALFPWRRSSRTFAWPPARRFSCELPKVLTGRKEISFLKRTRDAALNSAAPGFVAPANRYLAVRASDETFDELIKAHDGPVLVGFGATWQGQWWENVNRMLGAFADRFGPRLKVLVVNTDEAPVLARRFETTTIPVFKVLVRGEVSRSYSGPHSFSDLRREFGEFLK